MFLLQKSRFGPANPYLGPQEHQHPPNLHFHTPIRACYTAREQQERAAPNPLQANRQPAASVISFRWHLLVRHTGRAEVLGWWTVARRGDTWNVENG
jgi:hypothetical protein